MSGSAQFIGQIYIASALALGVILFALGAALVFYQRRIVALHREHAKRLLAAQEDERAWVARELHDDALQRVALLQHELDDWTGEHAIAGEHAIPHDRHLHRITALREELSDLGVMLRKVAHRLHPSIIEHAGLVTALHALATDIRSSSGFDVRVDTSAAPNVALLQDNSLILYRIAQEALRNAEKHGGTKHAQITLAQRNGAVVMTVADQGRGFDTTQQDRAHSLGLVSMTERARYAGGRIDIESQPGVGTVVRVEVPTAEGRHT
ncbi:MAG: sensor histidine kinase [Gemmatimonadaceae bacterium]